MTEPSTAGAGGQPGPDLRAARQVRYRTEIANAREAGGTLRMWAAIAVITGIVVALGIVVAMIAGWFDVEQGIEFLLLTSVTSIVSGTASYAAGWNVALGASRMELSLDDE
ncbi:hypothetical protein [Nakamurella leprariae]|uniref:Uncharacterized protein n=1 Tax=Nakamurella leprariae TaxID=2803911 RepID=A0A938YAE2_9ACTN|nr:hypothetical protein [Nakamurella leprariae]MBM9466952.1 hypothetical protein [Nakamurella leprariae]